MASDYRHRREQKACTIFEYLTKGAQDTTTAWPELIFSLSSPQEERAGERRPLLWNAPFPIPLPTRASRGEGENFWRLCQMRPDRGSRSRFAALPFWTGDPSGLRRCAKVRANRLLVAANDTHAGRRVLTLAQCVQGGDALPGRRRRQPFAQKPLRRQSRARPIAPHFQFGVVEVSQTLSSVAKQVLRFSNRQLRAHPFRRSSAVLLPQKQMRFGDRMKSYDGMCGIFSG